MAIATYFHPQSLTALQYDQAIRELDAAGAANPAGRLHLCVPSLVPRARDRTVTRSWAPVLAKIDLR